MPITARTQHFATTTASRLKTVNMERTNFAFLFGQEISENIENNVNTKYEYSIPEITNKVKAKYCGNIQFQIEPYKKYLLYKIQENAPFYYE